MIAHPDPTPQAVREFVAGRAKEEFRRLWRWVIPIGGGLLAAVLIVIGTPHVTWYLRTGLAVVAFLYISGQSAAYLWSSEADQGT